MNKVNVQRNYVTLLYTFYVLSFKLLMIRRNPAMQHMSINYVVTEQLRD
jgi:hypothetical protein